MICGLFLVMWSGMVAGPYHVRCVACPGWTVAIERQWISASGIFPAVRHDWDVRAAVCRLLPS